MQTEKTIAAARRLVRQWKADGLSVGLVPTMGSLHDGHRSLMEAAARRNDRIVVSIFVNPLQFGQQEDPDTYPRDLTGDMQICRTAGVDLIFAPNAAEMYPAGFTTFVDMEGPARGLCGGSRTGHFRGVCTVVSKLFHIVQPDQAYFGEKDAQQLAVIRRMTADLNLPPEIVGCPTVREPDGLAMSSRNKHLSGPERMAARCLYRALKQGGSLLAAGERRAEAIKASMAAVLQAEPLARPEYISVVDAETLQPVTEIDALVLCALAVRIGSTRLIDNLTFDPRRQPLSERVSPAGRMRETEGRHAGRNCDINDDEPC